MRILKRIIPVLVIVAILLLPVFTYAAPSWWPIVPCGLKTQPSDVTLTDASGKAWDYTQPCNQCLLLQLASNVINFVFFAIIPVIGTLLFIWAGFLILVGGGSGNSTMVGKGQTIFRQTIYGAFILLGSWLFTNTVIKTLAGDSDASRNWYNITCQVGNLRDITKPVVPVPGASTNPNPNPGQCLFTGIDLCKASATTPYSKSTMVCGFAACGQYLPAINQYASKWGVSPNLVKAIMVKESNCNVKAASSVAFGLMQFKPSTAIQVAQFCGVNKNVVNSSWLTNPQNASATICMGAYYMGVTLAKGVCGSDIRNIAAGYNGGPTGACSKSVSCEGKTSCTDGAPIRKWECLYDNPQNTTCNRGLNQARDYSIKVNYCYKNPGF